MFSPSRPTFRPRLECLEGRIVPSTFTLMVNPALDNAGAGAELKADIAAANADGQANTLSLFPGGVYTLTTVDNSLNGLDGLPDIASTLTINGQGATIQRSTASGTPAFRLFYVSGNSSGLPSGGLPTGDLTLVDLTLQGGFSKGGDSSTGGGGLGAGGAIFNQGTVTLLGVTLTGNTAQGGGTEVEGASGDGGGLGGDDGGGAAGGSSFFDGKEVGSPGGPGGFGGGGGSGGIGEGRFDSGGGAGGFGAGNGGNYLGEGDGAGEGLGGAVFSMFGSLTVINSTLSGNSAIGGSSIGPSAGAGAGGAVFNLDGAVTILDSTLAGNSVAAGVGSTTGFSNSSVSTDGGAVYNLAYGDVPGGFTPAAASLTLANDILAGSAGGTDLFNDAASTMPPAAPTAVVTATGPNLIRSTTATINGPAPLTGDPLLGPLQDNGGLSPTMALQPGSPAIDAGSNAAVPAGLTTDQRGPGFSRILGAAVDLGAFETGNPLPPQQVFVPALYQAALGRAATAAELNLWAAFYATQFNAALGAGAAQAQFQAQEAVASSIEHSAEARDHLVRGWYVTFLGWEAQGGEEQGWVNQLLAGASEEQVLGAILATPEFYSRAQTLGGSGTADQNFVQALYRLLLGRSGSDAETAGWIDALPQLGRQGVAVRFLVSTEYRTDLVQSYYELLLHRPADPLGLDGWVSSGLGELGVRVGIEASPEFFTNG